MSYQLSMILFHSLMVLFNPIDPMFQSEMSNVLFVVVRCTLYLLPMYIVIVASNSNILVSNIESNMRYIVYAALFESITLLKFYKSNT